MSAVPQPTSLLNRTISFPYYLRIIYSEDIRRIKKNAGVGFSTRVY